MLRRTFLSLTLGTAMALSGAFHAAAQAEELTIFWAEWDPANYLQELANQYTAETGVTVTVQTTPWPDFQTKAFAEFNAKGDAFDMVVGDSQWTGAGSTGGHYVDLTDFYAKNKVLDSMAPATVKAYSEYPGNSGKYWSIPLEGDAAGWAYRKDWFEDPKEMAAFKAKYGYDLAVPKDYKQLRDIAEFFYRPDDKRYGIAIYTDNSYDAMLMGIEGAIFSYGGELGDYSTYKVDGILNSPKNAEAVEMYKQLYGFTPPNWGKTFFQEDNQAITENLAAMSGQGISIVSYSKKQEESMKFLEWFIKDETQKKWAELGGYTCNKAVLESEAFRKATPYNEAFYQTMFMVKDFWAVPEYAELLTQINNHVYPYIVSGEGGSAQAVLDNVTKEWTDTFKKYGRGG
jgi:multiple sugar transport system substrate-binding protein